MRFKEGDRVVFNIGDKVCCTCDACRGEYRGKITSIFGDGAIMINNTEIYTRDEVSFLVLYNDELQWRPSMLTEEDSYGY